MFAISVIVVLKLGEATRAVHQGLHAIQVRTPPKRPQVDAVTQLGFAQEVCIVFFF